VRGELPEVEWSRVAQVRNTGMCKSPSMKEEEDHMIYRRRTLKWLFPYVLLVELRKMEPQRMFDFRREGH
jgi:hypothetical protein